MNHTARNQTLQFSVRGLLIATFFIAVTVAGIAALQRYDARQVADEARAAELNVRARAEAVKEVDAVLAQLGRAPANKGELVRLMGKPMPQVDVFGHPVQIEYDRTGTNSYRLYHWDLRNADGYVFDSSVTQAGWTPIYD